MANVPAEKRKKGPNGKILWTFFLFPFFSIFLPFLAGIFAIRTNVLPCALFESSQVRRLGFPKHPYLLTFMEIVTCNEPLGRRQISVAILTSLGPGADWGGGGCF